MMAMRHRIKSFHHESQEEDGMKDDLPEHTRSLPPPAPE